MGHPPAVSFMDIENHYATNWAYYRRLRRDMVLVLASIPVAALIMRSLLGTRFAILNFAAFIYVFLWPYVGWRHAFFPCPRCGKPFRGVVYVFLMPRKCGYCGLPKFASSADQ